MIWTKNNKTYNYKFKSYKHLSTNKNPKYINKYEQYEQMIVSIINMNNKNHDNKYDNNDDNSNVDDNMNK